MDNNIVSLAEAINLEHDRASGKAREALQHARRAGELLLQAKSQVEHGGWLPWITAKCSFSARQAQRYMLLAENWLALAGKYDTVSHLPIREALRIIERPRSELDRAREFGIRADRELREIRLRLGALSRIVNDPNKSVEELAWVARESESLHARALALNIEALAGMARGLNELEDLTGLEDTELRKVLSDGSLIRACNARMEQIAGRRSHA